MRLIERAAKFHKKIADKRDDSQWKAAHKVVNTADAVVTENLNIVGMKKRCQPVREAGRFLANGQSAKRGLNRSISDASWGAIFAKIDWLALKAGKSVEAVNPAHTSQTCPKCGHVDPNNREQEKFICTSCGHTDDADTNGSRNTLRKAHLSFPRKDSISLKNLPGDSRKVTTVSYESAPSSAWGQRVQGSNWTSKATPEIQIYRPENSIESPRL